MPTAPEFRYTPRKVGIVEVAHQVKAKQARTAYCDVGVSREITINLERKQYGNFNESEGWEAYKKTSVPIVVNGNGAGVGHNHLLEKSPKHLAAAVDGFVIFELPFSLELWQQIRSTLDRASYKLREETDVGKEFDYVVGRRQLFLVDIYGIAQGLEGIETNADGKYDLHRRPVGLHPEQAENGLEAVSEEIEILEYSEYAQIDDDVGGTDATLMAGVPVESFHQKSAEVTAQRRECYQQQKPPVPPAVEDVAGNEDERILKSQLPLRLADESVEYKPIEQEDYREEYEELNGVE